MLIMYLKDTKCVLNSVPHVQEKYAMCMKKLNSVGNKEKGKKNKT